MNGLAAFVRAAEARSFVAAGRQLGISSSGVGKSVARLEERLGVRLLQRNTRNIALTPEGALFFERCQRVLADLSEAEAELQRTKGAPRGTLRISLPAAGYRFLSPLLPEFARAFPEVDLDLDFDDRVVDVVERGFDAVIRSGELADSRLLARRLGPFRFLVVASPGYLRRKKTPRRPGDLAEHACLRYKFPTTGKVQPWGIEAQSLRMGRGITCNSVEALIAAAVRGLGLAYLPDFAVHEELAKRTLVSVLDPFVKRIGTFHVLWPANRLPSPKLRAFVDLVADRLFVEPGARPRKARRSRSHATT